MAGTTPGPDPIYREPRTHTLRTDAAQLEFYKACAHKAGKSLNAYIVEFLARGHGLLPAEESEQQLSLVASGGRSSSTTPERGRDVA